MSNATLLTGGQRPAVRLERHLTDPPAVVWRAITDRDELPAETAARNAAGWNQCLDRLAGRLPDPGGWRVQFEHYAAEFLSALGPQDGPPPGHKAVE